MTPAPKHWRGDLPFRDFILHCAINYLPLVVGFDEALVDGTEVELEGVRCLVVRDATAGESAKFAGAPGCPFDKVLEAPYWFTAADLALIAVEEPVGVH